VKQYFGKMDAGIYDLALSNNEKNLYAAIGCGTRELGDFVNDPNFSYSIALKLWNTPRNAPIFAINSSQIEKIGRGHQSGINAIAVASDEQFSVTASDDKTAIIWRNNGDSIQLAFHQKRVNDVAISPDGQLIATASDDSTAAIWSLDGKRQNILRGGMYPILRLAFLSKNTLVLTDSRGKIYFWTTEGTLIRSVQLPVQSNLLGLTIAPNGKSMLVGDGDSTAFLLNPDGHILKIFNISERNKSGGGGVYATAFSPDGKLVALGLGSDFCKIFTIDGQLRQTIYGKHKGFYVLKFSPDGKRLYAGCGDGFIRVYNNLTLDLK
jgi:WD40 repeat protein